MPSRKRKKTSCPFTSAKKAKWRRSDRIPISDERAHCLASSDRSSYFNQEKLLKDLDGEKPEQPEEEAVSASLIDVCLA